MKVNRLFSFFLLCSFLFSVALLSSSWAFPRAAAQEELLLEYDPDEEIPPSTPLPSSSSLVTPSPNPAKIQDQMLEGYRSLFELSQEEARGLQAVLVPLREDLFTLQTQLQVMARQQDRLREVERLLREKIIGLRGLDERLRVQQELLSLESRDATLRFTQVIRAFFQLKRAYLSEEGEVNLWRLLSTAADPADWIFQEHLLAQVSEQLIQRLTSLLEQRLEQERVRQELQLVQHQLSFWQERVTISTQVLAEQQRYQQVLLQKKGEEQAFFSEQLKKAVEDQRVIDERIQTIANGVTPQTTGDFPLEQMIWPVPPFLGISAHFRDADYKVRFGIEHQAVDIPTDQLTEVRAPLAGWVVETHDGGETGYSYLQLAHRDGVSTVYGHVYAFRVGKGDFVSQGQVVALSGGSIGTHGAGKLTTGPHLHFEILKDGTRVDPLNFLPPLP